MKEELLHFIWQSKFLLNKELFTTDLQPVTIIKPGLYNKDAGPDFFNAQLKIGDTIWAGNIEMHTQSSDWISHKHESNPAYNTVILHVVYQHNKNIRYPNGDIIPTLELKNLLPPALLSRYDVIRKNKEGIACEKILELPNPIQLSAFLQRLLIQRLETKCAYLNDLLVRTNQHWEQSFYILNARYFGMKTNAQPFEWLAERLPLHLLTKHKNSLTQLQALIFGVSGLISEQFHPNLKQEAAFLLKKNNLLPLSASIWKFKQTRPANFPTVRLEQFALFVHRSSHLLSKAIACETIQQLADLYRIENNGKAVLTNNAIHLILTNTVLPSLFHYGKMLNKPELCERALDFFEQIPAETNTITRFWKGKGLSIKTMSDSQAVIELNTKLCDQLDCLNCTIGQNILLHA